MKEIKLDNKGNYLPIAHRIFELSGTLLLFVDDVDYMTMIIKFLASARYERDIYIDEDDSRIISDNNTVIITNYDNNVSIIDDDIDYLLFNLVNDIDDPKEFMTGIMKLKDVDDENVIFTYTGNLEI
jgi:hypothetical protein